MAKENVDSLCKKAQHAITEGDYDQARRLYLQALGLRSDAPDVHYGLATVCFLLNDLTSAAHHFKEVTRLDPIFTRAGREQPGQSIGGVRIGFVGCGSQPTPRATLRR